MERFSINILRQQVYNICRLCGVDNPDKIPILGAEDTIFIAEDDEPKLAKKIEECVGIKVNINDQMPQEICPLCVDKVNDFYEYRLMCASTNLQTRTILNLPIVHPSTTLIKSEIGNTQDSVADEPGGDIKPDQKRGPKTRNRKKQPGNGGIEACSSEDADTKSFALDASSEKRVMYEYACQYCKEAYSQNSDLERHLVVKHTPLIHKFGCGSCMEYFDTASEYKDHNLWHKLTRTTFSCFRCNKKFVKTSTLNKHVETNACIRQPHSPEEQVTLVSDMRCTLCQKVFKTRNLYEWHGCFMRARANCPKCGKYFLKKNLLIRHFMLYCTGSLKLLEPILIPKDEPGTVVVNGGIVPPATSQRGATGESKRRGRPAGGARDSTMKEETIELPYPPLLDLPDIKMETDCPTGGQFSRSSGVIEGRKRLKSTLIEETSDKITTLLRTGASVDGNTDIATINSVLSSVNEAIATISKVRKKKRKREIPHSVDGVAAAGLNPPMVVLALTNVKQEEYGDPTIQLANLINSDGVPNEVNATISEHEDHRRDGSDHDDANSNETLADADSATDDANSVGAGDDFDADSDRTVNTQHATGSRSQTGKHAEILESEMLQPLQVKQEPAAYDEDNESDFEGYEDSSAYITVKQEPEETDKDVTETTSRRRLPPGNCSSGSGPYQALRIKIKKEKGLLNASVVAGDTSRSTKLTSTPAPIGQEASNVGKSHIATNRHKKPNRRNNIRLTATTKPLEQEITTVDLMGVRIKQERPDINMHSIDPLVEPHVESFCLTESTQFVMSQVHIKQEPHDDYGRAAHGTVNGASLEPDHILAFDGKRIKLERDVHNDTEKRGQHINNGLNIGKQQPVDSSRKAFNPLSLTGIRMGSGGKKSTTNQPCAAVMINPFALMKQKASNIAPPTRIPDGGQEMSSAEDREHQSACARPERCGLPVITQVKSIDPGEHLPLLLGSESVETTVTGTLRELQEQLQNDRNERGTREVAAEPPVSISEPMVTDIVLLPDRNVSELKIASVTSIRDVGDGDNGELQVEAQTLTHTTGSDPDNIEQSFPEGVSPQADDEDKIKALGDNCLETTISLELSFQRVIEAKSLECMAKHQTLASPVSDKPEEKSSFHYEQQNANKTCDDCVSTAESNTGVATTTTEL
uniref:ZAD domain-containing protein n=1 Tax=Anopheles dirus TaxID=7168 RepID=A0A182N9J7_9DIPT